MSKNIGIYTRGSFAFVYSMVPRVLDIENNSICLGLRSNVVVVGTLN